MAVRPIFIGEWDLWSTSPIQDVTVIYLEAPLAGRLQPEVEIIGTVAPEIHLVGILTDEEISGAVESAETTGVIDQTDITGEIEDCT